MNFYIHIALYFLLLIGAYQDIKYRVVSGYCLLMAIILGVYYTFLEFNAGSLKWYLILIILVVGIVFKYHIGIADTIALIIFALVTTMDIWFSTVLISSIISMIYCIFLKIRKKTMYDIPYYLSLYLSITLKIIFQGGL